MTFAGSVSIGGFCGKVLILSYTPLRLLLRTDGREERDKESHAIAYPLVSRMEKGSDISDIRDSPSETQIRYSILGPGHMGCSSRRVRPLCTTLVSAERIHHDECCYASSVHAL
jgi:hypothetical protein